MTGSTRAKPIVNWFSRLFSYYRAYHEPSPLLLRYMIIFGIVGMPVMYMLRFLRSSQAYDDLIVRLVDIALLALLALRAWWPERAKAYYLHFSYLVMTVTLPVTYVFASLMNGGGAGAVGSTFLAVFLLILLTDWRNLIVMLLLGFGTGIGLYLLVEPSPRMPMDYVARLPLLLLSIAGGSVFKYALEQGTAERVRQAYASLAGSIAHEMRNPLAQVRHSLEHIRHSLPLPSARVHEQVIDAHSVDQLYRHLSQGETAVRRGLQVIAMTLDEVSARAPDPGRLAYASAQDLCAKALEEYGYEDASQRARVSLLVRRDFSFRVDETAFLFVLFNLLKNALHYLPAYPDMRVRLEVDEGRISVCDTGPGIPPDLLEGLFRPFGTSGKSSGTGLGLAYCRRIVDALGGKISCASSAGGTSFMIELPAASPAELDAGRERVFAEGRRRLANKRVLVVDDDAAIRASTRQLLLSLACSVREASDGIEALQQLGESKYDVVVIDLNMPRMDGYELAESIRRGMVPANAQACLVAHTSEPAHLAQVKTRAAGFDGFVAKPAHDTGLVQALCAALDERSQRQARPERPLAGRRILLADDNAYNRSAVAALLGHEGAEVVEAASGRQALETLAGGAAFDAVLLDIQMPGMDGVETARRIRAGAAGEKLVPIIAITAHAAPEVLASGGAAGIADFVLKPVDAGVLVGKLAALLGLRTAVPLPAAEPPPEPQELLDERRLKNYRRIGMLQELVDDYMPQVDALVAQVVRAHELGDMDGAAKALHSMVGMSGEVGAGALYRYSREIYVRLLEDHQWPSDPSWPVRIRELTQRSNAALADWSASHPASTAE